MEDKKFTPAIAKSQKDVMQGIIDIHLANPNVSRNILNGQQVLFDEMTQAMLDVKEQVGKKFALIDISEQHESRHRFDHHEDSDYVRVSFW